MITDLIQPDVLFPWLLSMAFGVFVGATPGLTATMAVALIVPISFYAQNPNTGLAMIIGVSFTAIFAGDIPATFLRIPGTPASAAATLDGHVLAQKGQGKLAITVDLFCSVVGGLIGVALLVFLAPQLARFALRFSHFEYFWLATFGLCMSAVVSGGQTYKGLLAAALGMLLATAGIDLVSGAQRFTFSNPELMSGLEFIPVMIGLFGLSEVLRNITSSAQASSSAGIQSKSDSSTDTSTLKEGLLTVWKHKWTVLKSSCVGTGVGALPGAGADIAAWGSYGLAQRTSTSPEKFGKGHMEGVVAPTSANNAAIGGAWIPALVFGIPGDAVTAIVLGALLMYEIKPGPLIFEQSGSQVNSIFLIAFLTQFLLLPCGYLGIKAFSWILKLPRSVIMTGVMIFSVVGSYALRNSLFDVWVMAIFGLVGFFLESHKMPLAPLILGLILGPMVETNLRTGLIKAEGSFLPFLTRPICSILILFLVLAFLLPSILNYWRNHRERTDSKET